MTDTHPTATAADEQPVWFDEQAEPVYVRVRSARESAEPAVVQVLEFFDRPRAESAAVRYLVGLGYSRRTVKKFVGKKYLTRIDAGNANKVVGSLKRIRVVSDCGPIPNQKHSWGLAVRRWGDTDEYVHLEWV
ncbi:hypothetical protein ACPPVQ_05815 [Diaminobutyricibacter sp. McL0618]|uniref:hypothetical protein n=1 Tax=Leifsonia sp. McL0618 TaxID=3415677 RepID=UPI003CF88860